MESVYGIAAYRSRQQVLRLEATLRAMGIESRVVSTPRAVASGCGLSVRFAEADLPRVLQAQRQYRFETLVGLYRVDARSGRGDISVYSRG